MKLFLVLYVILNTLYLIRPSPAFAQSAWAGRCVSQGDVATIQGFECLFANALSVVSLIAGLVFLVTFITNGFNLLLSGSDPKKMAAAGSSLTLAFVGLIGVIASWFILRLIQNFTGINVVDFVIPG